MAKEIKWDNVTLTSDEVRTLNELRNQGKCKSQLKNVDFRQSQNAV